MKKLGILGVLLMAVSLVGAGSALAKKKRWKRPYGMAGCGLGSQAMGRDGSQILASTTNGTSANQLFGITSGTSNCVDGPGEEVAQKMDRFIESNKVALAGDMARGNGEALQALGSILGCRDVPGLGASLQKNFRSIYPDERVHTMDVTDSVINVILEEPELKGNCSNLKIS